MNCLLVLMFVIVISLIYHLKVDKISQLWLLYTVAQDILQYIPLTAGLGIFWGLVIRSRDEAQNPIPISVTSINIIFYIIIMMAGSILFQELLIPKIYNMANYQMILKDNKLMDQKKIKDITGSKFTITEFNNLKYMDVKNNIAFFVGNSIIYFEKMYNGNGSYYINGFRFIAYNKKNQLDFILTSKYAKIVDNELYSVNPTFFGYTNGKLDLIKIVNSNKKIPIGYQADALYNLTSDYRIKVVSLIDIFMYNDYIYNSSINLYRLGNIVFNKLSFYITLIILLIISSITGMKFRNQRLVNKDYFLIICFYIVSTLSMFICYDILISIANMVYGMVV